MYLKNLKSSKTLYQGLAVLIATAMFVVGRFGFFDILGLKRLLEILIFVPVVFFGTLLILRSPNQWLNPFFLLPCSCLLVLLSWDWDLLFIADLGGSILIVAIIITLGEKFSELLLRYTIRIATFFACLGIVEFIIMLLKPSLVSQILLFYDNYSGSNVPVIQNAWQLLGLADGTSYHLWGMAVTRLRSFTSEPSLLVGYFLVPGALGLTYQGKFAKYGMICIFFCICSLAGSVFVALCSSAFIFMLLPVKNQRLFTYLPFFMLTVFIWILYTHFNELILLTKSTAGGYDFLDKTNSANMRFSYIREYIPKVIEAPFGLTEEIHQPLGLLIGGLARGGIIGLILTIIILLKLYSSLAFLLVNQHLRLLQKIGLCIIYGSLLAGILYLDNCFVQMYGFTLLVLIYNRLIKLRQEVSSS
ncbi:MAG: hypothetical protein V4501_10660 [Pseudomonadota bacterium]